MIQIRPEQFAAFQQESEGAFVDSLLKFARENLTVWVKFDSDEIVRERIKSFDGEVVRHPAVVRDRDAAVHGHVDHVGTDLEIGQ